MGVSSDVDDVIEITVEVIGGVANLLLSTFYCKAVPYVPLLIAYSL